jgi:hypothetical protein
MSEWVIHFVHDRNPRNDAFIYDGAGEGEPIPLHADANKASRFDPWSIKEAEMLMPPDADALSVLLRIMDDGHIRCGWSLRNGRATIYGPRAACCFTEMPLYALLHYARGRGNSLAVDCYGIALPKRELFAAGGRPAIYGLSGQHQESGDDKWPRRLHPNCGIAEWEQYRYVAMKLGDDHPIDWSHEREWRWADVEDKFGCPGLPVWLENGSVLFSRAIIIVRTRDEAEQVLDKLKLMRDSKTDQYDNPYVRAVILDTRVLAVEDALGAADEPGHRLLRIDDVPVHQLKEAVAAVPSEAVVIRVANTIKKAKEAADEAAKQWRATHGRMDVFGFAYLMVVGPRTEIVEAMLQLNEINATALSDGIGYRMANIGGSYDSHLLGEAENAVEAAKVVLQHELPNTEFYIRTVWD